MRCVSVTRRSCHLMCYQRSTNELTVNKPPFNYLLTQSFRPVSRPRHPIYRRPWLRLECHCWLYRTSYTSRRGARGAAGDVVVGEQWEPWEPRTCQPAAEEKAQKRGTARRWRATNEAHFSALRRGRLIVSRWPSEFTPRIAAAWRLKTLSAMLPSSPKGLARFVSRTRRIR